MAGAHTAAAATFPPLPPPSPTAANPRVSIPSLPSSFPSRVRRTNHLRQKILKTLENKPYPDPSLPEFPSQTQPISIDETHQQQPAESEQFSHSEGAGFVDGVLGTFSTKSFAKIGLYLVGAFVFQTICALLIFGSKDLDDEDENLNSDEFENQKKLLSKSKSKSNLMLSVNLSSIETKEVEETVLVNDSEMDNRIMEIQEMARRARQQEKAEAKRKGLVEEEEDEYDDDDDDIGYDEIDKAMKMKEVDERLTKLRRSLEGNYQKPAPKFPRKEGDVGKNLDTDSLMFKKKYKYKSPSIDSRDKPKGFNGAKDVYVANGTVINDGGTLSNDIGSGPDEENDQEPRATKAESIPGNSKEPRYNKQAIKAEKSAKSSSLDTKKPRGFGNDTPITTKHDDFNKNGSLKGKGGINKKFGSSTQTKFWWTSLPFVMAVHMERGGNSEESKGLFVLRDDSPAGNRLSHTVAFEDRSDAANFSYLLESFFQDLNDFRTNILPIPTNELEEEVKSQRMKVVVVKKGQLKLYVGQPLEDVESALRALIEQ